ncbi:hypothetical protein Amet_3204 [Alkaliphilus metalliredigens QYMF]|uniref:Uncharacterized protein n=1 Tax=Alkaliphilus metalliredigens (strain QYMF) TaxID=293826 RepID=A6TT24_ALKMQ|nr:hypothetical protein [Alkaliphilus metalliredigens]ABR49342.1 hypothetical protein Amet_3204 [Alkaliphilus metalliredigens QYMF]
MNIILVLLITVILSIDFARLKKNKSEVLSLYIAVVAMILLVAAVDKYDFFETSPLEIGIRKLLPVTNWLETKFN